MSIKLVNTHLKLKIAFVPNRFFTIILMGNSNSMVSNDSILVKHPSTCFKLGHNKNRFVDIYVRYLRQCNGMKF